MAVGGTGATLKRRSEQKGGNEATRVFGRNAQIPAVRRHCSERVKSTLVGYPICGSGWCIPLARSL
jgi:hypothetical protein